MFVTLLDRPGLA